ncbi:MAG: sulfite exporter TauE/SafE family protein [Thiohalomonadaceae bacterium]
MLAEFLPYLFIGAFAGTIAGLLGVGGGLLIVPALALLLPARGVAPDVVMHLALGTSLATIVLTSVSSVTAHHRRGAVLWPVFARLTPGILAGAWLGATVAHALPAGTLRLVFGIFALLVALQMGFGAKPPPQRVLPGSAGLGAAGGVIGFVSAIVGIGGGSLTVPFLVWCNTPMRAAVATSAAVGLPIAVAGAAGYVFMGLSHPDLPSAAVGYVHLPALLGISLASVLFAPLGARLAHAVPAASLKRFFAVFLAVLGLRMLVG